MSVLRSLSVIYLLAASIYAVAVGLANHPAMADKSAAALNAVNHSVLEPGWALAVAETRPRGPTGRVGPVNARASPEMRPGSHHDDWAATPQAAPSH